ncbi:MAG TPA: radical SAM protein [Spirochaetia bacterium]|nr:radical SAM protein [Spirochaetia bacterium]
MRIRELAWINDFYREISPYIFIRDEDRVLIIPPNRVYKLNATGMALIRHLSRGHRIERLPGLSDGPRAGEVNAFFSDLRDLYGGYPEFPDRRKSVERVSYTFDFTCLPILGEIAVTYRCNNRCLFCYAGCGPAAAACGRGETGTEIMPRSYELSLSGIKRIIRIFKEKAKIPFFSFTGGEPLLRCDLEKMIAFATRIGLRVNLISNGTLATEKRARTLHASGLRTAQISLESFREEVHDGLTGTAGSFRRTIAGLGHLLNAGISVQTNTTLNSVNIDKIELMPAFLRTLGIERFAMNLFIPTSSVGAERNGRLFLSYSEVACSIDRIRKAAEEQGLTFYWYSPLPYCLYNPIAKGLGNKSCAAMDGLISVSPKGDVLPCSSYPEPMGNLLDRPFEEIWFSERAAFFKKKRHAPAGCRDCESFTACQGACPLYWKFAGTGELDAVKPRVEEVTA